LFLQLPNVATIQNVIMKNVYVYNDYNICKNQGDGPMAGGISGKSSGKIYNCGIESGEIIATKKKYQSNLLEYAKAGGIIGFSSTGEIDSCYNKATVKAEVEYKEVDAALAGGIGNVAYKSITTNCYNKGEVIANGPWIYIGGITSVIHEGETVKNCYNIGKITHNATLRTMAGQIAGQVNQGGIQTNNYTSLTTASNLGTTKWQEDQKDEKGNWLYNNGYPILKWQFQVTNSNKPNNQKQVEV